MSRPDAAAMQIDVCRSVINKASSRRTDDFSDSLLCIAGHTSFMQDVQTSQ
jgi:hypothetical protein